MYLRFFILLLHTVVLIGIKSASAEESANKIADLRGGLVASGPFVWRSVGRIPSSSSNTLYPRHKQDDIYIDDEVEGSGRGAEVRNDLEASGSGYGPDDEDGDGGSDVNLNNKVTQVKSVPPPKEPEYGKETVITGGTHKNVESVPPDNGIGGSDTDSNGDDNNHSEVYIMNTKPEERSTSFFAQPGILAAVIGGAVVGLLCAILVVMFIVYRMRKKDEGSYALEEPKRSPTANSYLKNSNREFYA
ncbi:syndecan-2-B-like isoform X2 [Lycorma delicatula]|uniref:syndecan-2-B-like isoform X2 n=1 Tax=Lycorma delicatula TaxID=130591 RepID=UPI003F5199DB